MPRTGRKGKRPNSATDPGRAKRSRKESLTQDDIPAIVEAVVDTMRARANPESGGEGRSSTVTCGGSTRCTTNSQRRDRRQVTHVSADSRATQSHSEAVLLHATDSTGPTSEATDTDSDHVPAPRHNTESNMDQEIGEYIS